MTFKIFVHPSLFIKVPAERKESIKSAIKELTNPFPDSNGDKKELKGTRIVTYRLRAGDYRIFYQIDEEEKEVYVFDILTAEQAHKKYGRM
ncbi:RelE/StbE replicon stabilization toxin [Methanosarcina lacustris Z-7289]|uniref:RelE/StbE replicon stabilization toxin n=1 Tax=Methanosarcina lacustris Z-7289 TaxID=1434111 RepID=A0A0E3WRM9_9EURY|nr:type II toxin-antitoxin system RelE/ParE family toxin [Methanosarcina lacustris]AKB75335.1 RelE/StbE replicon stabilization toxin [Methanosarcina lacustris Z-7289]